MDILAYIDRIEDLYGNVLPKRKKVAKMYSWDRSMNPPWMAVPSDPEHQKIFLEEFDETKATMHAEGGRVNFANGSEAKKIDAYTQAKTDFKGKVWDTVEEAVESNKKIMKKWDPKVVKETIVEKRLRKYGWRPFITNNSRKKIILFWSTYASSL